MINSLEILFCIIYIYFHARRNVEKRKENSENKQGTRAHTHTPNRINEANPTLNGFALCFPFAC